MRSDGKGSGTGIATGEGASNVASPGPNVDSKGRLRLRTRLSPRRSIPEGVIAADGVLGVIGLGLSHDSCSGVSSRIDVDTSAKTEKGSMLRNAGFFLGEREGA